MAHRIEDALRGRIGEKNQANGKETLDGIRTRRQSKYGPGSVFLSGAMSAWRSVGMLTLCVSGER